MSFPRDSRKSILFCFLICLLSFAPFATLLNAGFVNLDDTVYVTENPRVQKGITLENIGWAFTTTYFGFYYPVTWLSHMLDCSLFGLNPGGHHLTSIVIHALNSLLLFLFFRRATSDETKSFVLSALFAIHPLNVESVAWISERKNLLAGFFFLLGLNLYLNYVKSPTPFNFIKVFICYILGLMSKTVLVTFAPGLLLLDIWPLGRLEFSRRFLQANKKVLAEKLLFLVPVPVFSYLTISAQKDANALAGLSNYPMDERIAGAILAYARYIYQFFFRFRFTAFYPHLRNNYSLLLLMFSAGMLVTLTIVFMVMFKRDKACLTGWLWFLGHLVPVIGIIQVGSQASADRYMYIPMIGLLIITVFGLGRLFTLFSPVMKKSLAVILLLFPAVLFVKSYDQALTWKDSEALFSNMTAVSPGASLGYYKMGLVLYEKGKYAEAISCYRRAAAGGYEHPVVYNSIGRCFAEQKDWGNAIDAFRKACALSPGSSVMKFDLAMAYELSGDKGSAELAYREVMEADTRHVQPRKKLIAVLMSRGKLAEALKTAEDGMALFPEDPEFKDLEGRIKDTMRESAKPDAMIGKGTTR